MSDQNDTKPAVLPAIENAPPTDREVINDLRDQVLSLEHKLKGARLENRALRERNRETFATPQPVIRIRQRAVSAERLVELKIGRWNNCRVCAERHLWLRTTDNRWVAINDDGSKHHHNLFEIDKARRDSATPPAYTAELPHLDRNHRRMRGLSKGDHTKNWNPLKNDELEP